MAKSVTMHMLQRLRGKRVRFVTGTDEHGEKIAEAAKARGVQPKEHCDSVVEMYKALWNQVRSLWRHAAAWCDISLHPSLFQFDLHSLLLQLDISYDAFIRTTDKRHEVMYHLKTKSLLTTSSHVGPVL